MSLETSLDILYNYARENRGSTRFVNALIRRVEDEAHLAKDMDGPLLAQIIVTFNLCGHKGDAF